MLYQPLLNSATNYVATISKLGKFPMHAHHEIEMLYCLEGSFDAKINYENVRVEKGSAIVIGSMAAHEIISNGKASALLIEIGPFFLHENFSLMCNINFDGYVFDLGADDLNENLSLLKSLLDETSHICTNKDKISDIAVVGNLYKISACLLSETETLPKSERMQKPVPQISKALELVYYNYRENISVDDAAKITNYGKSNFCKIFKNSIGMSFHQYLNTYRIKNAECLLSATEKSMDEIATMCGFADQKIFSRVFKSINGISPSVYRKKFR